MDERFRSVHFPYKAILPSVLAGAKSDDLESHAPFRGILKAKRNFEILSEQAIFEPTWKWVGGEVGVGGG